MQPSAPLLPILPLLALALLSGATTSALAQTPAAPQGVVNLSARASVEVPRDVLSVSFSATHDGADAQSVQNSLKQALDAALAEARKIAKPPQVEVRAGNFSVYPHYTPKGISSGWRGSAELQVEGRDLQAIAQLTGRIQNMTITRVGYALSREARDRVESEVTARAIARFRARAGEIAEQLGYGGYTIREVTVATDEAAPPFMPMMRAMSASAAVEALPVEPGTGDVSVTVSGSVQMK